MYSDSREVIEGASSMATRPALEQDELKKQALVVHGVNGILTTLNMRGILSIQDLKTRIQIFTGIPLAEQRLLVDGTILLPSDPVPKREVFVLRVAISPSRCNRKAHDGLHSPQPKELEPGPTFLPPQEEKFGAAALSCNADCHRGARNVSSLGYGRKGDWCKVCEELNIGKLQSSGFAGFAHMPKSTHEQLCVNL